MANKAPESQDGQTKVYITRDGMEAYLTVSPPRGDGRPVDFRQAMDALEKAGVVHGIDVARVGEALEERNWNRSIVVAKGTPPVHGEDGRVEYKFSLPGQKVGPAETANGKVDYRNLNLICNVNKGALLAVKIDPKPGVPGMAVTGNPVPPRMGKEVVLRRGKNTVLDDTGHCLYSAADGRVVMDDDKIVVEAVYEIRGDVDFSTGNIDFVGSVIVGGEVTSGFVVKAGQDIEINGGVEAAQLIAGGNITIRKGIAGGDKGMIQAGGKVVARFIENARVIAGSEVTVQDAIIQSFVRSNSSVQVEGRRGTIVGGLIQARDEISARVIGSTFATQTHLEVGVDPEIREEYRSIVTRHKEKKKAFDVVAQNLQMLQRSVTSPDNLSGKQRMALIKLLEEYKSLSAELKQMEERRAFLEQEFNRLQGGRIKVLDIVYPGVHITIGRAVYVVNDPIKYAMFILEDGEVKITSVR